MSVKSWFNPNEALTNIARDQKRRMRKAAHVLAADVKMNFTKGGKTGKKSPRYIASKDGEAPSIQTGTLRRSIIAEVHDEGGENIGLVGPMATVGGVSLKYAKWLEFGTSKMKARPYLRPALARKRNEIYGILANG